MQFTDRLFEFPCLEQVIDRSPLVVTPNTSVLDAIALMTKARGKSCQLPNSNLSPDLTPTRMTTTSCVLVMEGARLLGLFTEGDVVKHTTVGTDLSKVAIAEVMTREVITFTESDSEDLFTVLSLLRQHRISHLPILDDKGQLLGIFTPETIRQLLHPTTLLKFWRVCELMTTEVIYAPPTASVLKLAQLMTEHCVSCVVITEEGKSCNYQFPIPSFPGRIREHHYQLPIGIITERDIVQFQLLGLDLGTIEAKTVMSAPLFCLNPDDSVWLAHQEMQRRSLRRMVVVGEVGELRGILTQTNYLQVFDPIEMLTVTTVLRQKPGWKTELTQVNKRLQPEVLERRRMEELLLQAAIESEKMEDKCRAELSERNTILPEEMMQGQRIDRSLQGGETYRLLFENNPQPMWIFDPENLAFLSVNEAASCHYGYSKSEFLLMTIADIQLPEDIPAMRETVAKLSVEGYVDSGLWRHRKKDGTIIDVKITSNALTFLGKPARFICATDVTERKQAEKSQRDRNDRLTLALDLAQIGSWDWNLLANETIWTPKLEKIFGYELGTPRRTYKDWYSRVHPEDLPSIQASRQAAIASRNDWECEYRIVWLDGSIHWVASLGRFYYNALGKPTRMVGVLYEISDRKQVQEALRNSQEQLQAAISELTRSNKELENFAYAASHDLQEPLRKINSFAELLAEDYRQRLDQTADKYIDYITDGASRMQALIEDLLIYSRVGRVELNKQATDLNSVLSQVIIDLGVAIAENNANITTTPLPILSANPVQMAQLLQNLIANGIKFRREADPQINIAATLQKQQWLISVRDNGIGIKPEYMERIFAIFQRLHSRSRYAGNGIGLALCRKIVERHGGQIWLESEPGKGTIFYFTIPE